MSLKTRFFDKISPEPNSGCWLWTGAYSHGYGQIKNKNVTTRAHRVSYELFVGPIPDGLYVLHKCDVPCCVNPGHLFLGTQIDNMRDCVRKGRMARNGNANRIKTHCPKGHEYTPENTYRRPSRNGRDCRECKRQWARKNPSKNRVNRLSRGPSQ